MPNHMTPLEVRLDRIEVALTRQNDEVLNAKQAAAYLDLSLSHLYRLTSERRIQYYKPGGGRIYFRKSELDTYILTRPVSTREQITALADRYVAEIATGGRRPSSIASRNSVRRGA